MGFVQVIEFRTSRIDEMRAIADQWEERAAGEGKARRRILGQDHDDPGRYFNIVFFDSYEEAMENSDLPITREFSQQMMALADGPPTFSNLDVVEERG